MQPTYDEETRSWSGSARRVGRDSLLLVAVSLAVLLPGLWQNHNWAGLETLHAEVGREMAERGDFLIPTRLGGPYHDRPAVHHAMVAGLMRLTGTRSIFVARLPSAIAGVAGVLATYSIGLLLVHRRIARTGAFAMLALPGYVEMARIVRPDMVFASLVFVSTAALGWGMRRQGVGTRLGLFALAGIAAGLATVTKGAHALLVPIRKRDLARPRWFEVAMILFATAASISMWAVPVWLRDGGEYLRSVLGGGLEFANAGL